MGTELPDGAALLLQQEMREVEAMFHGTYRVLRHIGRGTFSDVFLADRPDQPGVQFAMKKVCPSSSPLRVWKEMEILHKLGGCNSLAALVDCERRDDVAVLVLPYFEHVEFQDLAQSLDIRGTRRYMHELLRAVAFLHSHAIIHRDIKPKNFLFHPRSGKGLLIDFGLSQRRRDWERAASAGADVAREAAVLQRARALPVACRGELGNVRRIPLDSTAHVPADIARDAERVRRNVTAPTAPTSALRTLPGTVATGTATHDGTGPGCGVLSSQPGSAIPSQRLGARSAALPRTLAMGVRPQPTLRRLALLPRGALGVAAPAATIATLPNVGRAKRSRDAADEQPVTTGDACGARQPPSVRCTSCRHVLCPGKAERGGTPGFRAPEVLLGFVGQTPAVDVWAVGVIFLCLLTRRYPFFDARGNDFATGLLHVGALLGTAALRRAAAACGVAVEALPRELPRGSQLRAACAALRPAGGGEVPEQAMDLLERLMDPDPFTRISAAEALSHPFITGKQPDCGA